MKINHTSVTAEKFEGSVARSLLVTLPAVLFNTVLLLHGEGVAENNHVRIESLLVSTTVTFLSLPPSPLTLHAFITFSLLLFSLSLPLTPSVHLFPINFPASSFLPLCLLLAWEEPRGTPPLYVRLLLCLPHVKRRWVC